MGSPLPMVPSPAAEFSVRRTVGERSRNGGRAEKISGFTHFGQKNTGLEPLFVKSDWFYALFWSKILEKPSIFNDFVLFWTFLYPWRPRSTRKLKKNNIARQIYTGKTDVFGSIQLRGNSARVFVAEPGQSARS